MSSFSHTRAHTHNFRMLVPKEGTGKGWQDALMPHVPEEESEKISKLNRPILRCKNKKKDKEECGRFFWGPAANLCGQRQQVCELCLRHKTITEKIPLSSSPVEPFAPLQMHEFKWAITHKKSPIMWEVKAIREHEDTLKRYKSPQFLDTNPDQFETAAAVRHHKLCITLLELFKREVKCFQLIQQGETLGYFEGSLSELEVKMRDVEQHVANIMQKPPVAAKKKRLHRADIAVNKEIRPVPPEVPMVCVCVEGGPGTIDTVLDAAKLGTACLLVKDSGRAADWLSDAVSLKDVETRPKVLDMPQQAFMHFLEKDLRMKSGKKGFNYKELVSRFSDSLVLLMAYKAEQKIKKWETLSERCAQWHVHQKDDPALSEAMRLEFVASELVKTHYNKGVVPGFCVTEKMKKVFEAANTHMCQAC